MARDVSEDNKIIEEAKKRFNRCEEWEAEARSRFLDDLRFANADADNMWQWDQGLAANRVDRQKPCLTINKTRQHNLQIINDAKQNKPGVNIRPVGDGADYDAAQVFEGVVRHIEYQSNAEQVYDTATTFQVQGGIGYWRVITDYVSDDSFDQEIFLKRIKNPLSVYLDPDISEADGSDARFGFVFEDVPRDQFEAEYPDDKDNAVTSTLGNTGDQWANKDTVRIAEYYRKEQKSDKLITFVIPLSGQQIIVRQSDMTPELREAWKQYKGEQGSQSRDIVRDEITWYKIAGNTIIDERPWPGKYIPIVRVIGEETIIEGQMDRKGHTRSMIDPQRMYNYWLSEATAQVALQTQTPFIAPVEAIEGLETYWGKLNLEASSILPYNAYAEEGQRVIPAPARTPPPVMASAYIDGMKICENGMMMASGQYQSQFGENENAKSGKAISERQRQGDNATYHYIDNLAIAIRYTGKIFIDLIPKIYDTARVIQIVGKDGEESSVQIQPDAGQAYQEGSEDAGVAAIFNPNVGRYEVESDVGPGYATKRQQAFDAMTTIAAQNKDFMHIAGDLLFKAADFPEADALAERYKKIIPANITGDGPSAQEQQLQQQLQQAHDAIVMLQKKLTDQQQDINIKGYDATTKRITALGNAGPIITPDQLGPIIRQTLIGILTEGPNPEGSAQGPQSQPPSEPGPSPAGPQSPQPMSPMGMAA